MTLRTLMIAMLMSLLGLNKAYSQSLHDAVEDCREIVDDTQRLACFDKMAKNVERYTHAAPIATTEKQGLKSEVALSRDVENAPITQSMVEQPSVEFGLEGRRDRENYIDEKSLIITSISQTVRGKNRFTFNDNSVWQQTDNKFLKLSVGQKVQIERGILGAFYLGVEGLNKRLKVKRLK